MISQDLFQQLDSKLKQMKGQTFLYMGTLHILEDWAYEDDDCTVKTSQKWIKKPFREALTMLSKDFLEVEAASLPVVPSENAKEITAAIEQIVTAPRTKTLQVCDVMMDELVAAVKNVRENPDYKGQAQTIANIAKQAIDMAKVELDHHRFVRDIIRNR